MPMVKVLSPYHVGDFGRLRKVGDVYDEEAGVAKHLVGKGWATYVEGEDEPRQRPAPKPSPEPKPESDKRPARKPAARKPSTRK